MAEKKMKIRGFENMTIEEYMKEKSKREILKQFPGKEGRQRPRNPLERAALLELREKYGDDQGTI